MTKKMIRVTVETYVDIDWTPLDEFIMMCQNWLEEYGPTARFEYEYNDDNGRSLVLSIERMETDEEYEKRIKDEEYWSKIREIDERKMFERLKAKFGE